MFSDMAMYISHYMKIQNRKLLCVPWWWKKTSDDVDVYLDVNFKKICLRGNLIYLENLLTALEEKFASSILKVATNIISYRNGFIWIKYFFGNKINFFLIFSVLKYIIQN